MQTEQPQKNQRTPEISNLLALLGNLGSWQAFVYMPTNKPPL